MRIAYFCYWNIFSTDGVTAKIATQIAEWRTAGHEVHLFCLSPAPPPDAVPSMTGSIFAFGDLAQRMRATARMMRSVAEFRPDVIYVRYDLFLPPPGRLLRRFATVVEVNEDDRLELALRAPRARAYNELNRRSILGSATGFVCVTHETARVVSPFDKPTVVVANGIDLASRPVLAPATGPRPRLAFLHGAAVVWQGVDKLLEMARAMPECDFALIGLDSSRLPEPTSNVELHGVLSRAGYEPILARSDAAIGTLALHRKGMEEATPLKVREYLAYGLPVIIAYQDTEFIGMDPWFLLRLPNTESNVRDHLDDIRAFVEAVRGRRVPREAVAQVIGADGKEAVRLEFLERMRSLRARSSLPAPALTHG